MNTAHPVRKQKVKHELREMLEIFLYLSFFFWGIPAGSGRGELLQDFVSLADVLT